jgi:hypothetical protein
VVDVGMWALIYKREKSTIHKQATSRNSTSRLARGCSLITSLRKRRFAAASSDSKMKIYVLFSGPAQKYIPINGTVIT